MAEDNRGDTTMAVSRADLEKFRRLIGTRHKAVQAFGDVVSWLDRLSPDILAIVLDAVSADGEVRLLEMMLERARDRAAARVVEVGDLSADNVAALREAVKRPDVRILLAEVEAGEPMPTATVQTPAPKTKPREPSSVKAPAKESVNEMWNRLLREGQVNPRRR